MALHSSASSSSQWKRLPHDLEGRFAVHALDLPGYGKSPLVGDHSKSGASISALPVIGKIEQLGEAVHLVGHSNGAGVAIKVALLRPDLVKSLTVYEPAIFHFLKNGDAQSRQAFQDILLISGKVTAAAATGDVDAGMKHFLDFWNGEGFWEQLPTNAKQKFAGMINSILSDFANGFAENWELSELHELEIPALVMMGLESPVVAQRAATMIANALPRARLALLPELGHMAPVFHPEWINPRILEHVTGVERPIVNCSWPSREAA